MSFEAVLRTKIGAAAFGSVEKSILKVVLGEVQLASSRVPRFSDEAGYTIVKKMVEANTSNLTYLKEGDERIAQYTEENRILSTLLPTYLTADQIEAEITSGELLTVVKAAGNEGQAMGKVMAYFKTTEHKVEGDVVKQVVKKLREAQ